MPVNHTRCSRKKAAQCLAFDLFTFDAESRCMQQNVLQRLLSTDQCKTYVNEYSLPSSWKSQLYFKCMSQWPRAVAKLETRSGLPADKCFVTSLSYQTAHQTHTIKITRSTRFGRSAAISSEAQGHWPSQTSAKQLMGHVRPRTDQRCYWAVVRSKRLLLVVVLRMGTLSHWASFALIMWRLLVANFTSVILCLEKVPDVDVFAIVHLSSAKQRIFNCNIQTAPYSRVITWFLNILMKTSWLDESRFQR